MNLKNIAIASVAVGGFVLLSAFGGNKITLDEQMKAIDAAVSENVASFESNKRAECKAMAVQKAIGLAEAKMAATKAVPGKKTIAVAPVKKAVPTKKGSVKPAPAPTVKPATPTNPKKDRMDSGTNGTEDATKAKKDRMDSGTNGTEDATKAKKGRMNGGN